MSRQPTDIAAEARTLLGGKYTVTNTAATPQQFFRLRK